MSGSGAPNAGDGVSDQRHDPLVADEIRAMSGMFGDYAMSDVLDGTEASTTDYETISDLREDVAQMGKRLEKKQEDLKAQLLEKLEYAIGELEKVKSEQTSQRKLVNSHEERLNNQLLVNESVLKSQSAMRDDIGGLRERVAEQERFEDTARVQITENTADVSNLNKLIVSMQEELATAREELATARETSVSRAMYDTLLTKVNVEMDALRKQIRGKQSIRVHAPLP